MKLIKKQDTGDTSREGAACRLHLGCNFSHIVVAVSKTVHRLCPYLAQNAIAAAMKAAENFFLRKDIVVNEPRLVLLGIKPLATFGLPEQNCTRTSFVKKIK